MKGAPSVAQMACEEKWWAVKNLVRRKVVPKKEMFQKYQGKDAIEWAKHHGVTGMAQELEYYFITVRNNAELVGRSVYWMRSSSAIFTFEN
jgi:hypothetical protein